MRGRRPDRVRDGAGRDQRQPGPLGDRLRRVERDREHQPGVRPGATEAPAPLGLALGQRDRAVRGTLGEHPLGRRCLLRPVVLPAVGTAQRRQDDVRRQAHAH